MRSLLFICILSCFAAASQPVGYLGKKVIIKTNIINGIRLGFNSLDGEYVLNRQSSFTAGIHGFKYRLGAGGRTVKNGVVTPRNGYCNLKEKVTLSNGVTKGWIVSIGGKHYFNKIMPAPMGIYLSFDFGFGMATLSGFSTSYEYTEARLSTCFLEQVNYPLRENVTELNGKAAITYLEFPSVGIQKIFAKYVVLDAKLSLQVQNCFLPEEFVNALERNHYVRSNTFSTAIGTAAIGPAVFVKLGYLIF